ncbi:hypothetical protein ACU686_24525 [Yinghuangia aomiensis]
MRLDEGDGGADRAIVGVQAVGRRLGPHAVGHRGQCHGREVPGRRGDRQRTAADHVVREYVVAQVGHRRAQRPVRLRSDRPLSGQPDVARRPAAGGGDLAEE